MALDGCGPFCNPRGLGKWCVIDASRVEIPAETQASKAPPVTGGGTTADQAGHGTVA
jgi:hypothetical protein